MRIAVLVMLLAAALQPWMVAPIELAETDLTMPSAGNGVDVIAETEPNNVNTSGQEVYPGDVVRGAVDMWDDELDWFTVWLEPGQTLLLTLSHAAGDGVSMSVWDENNTHLGASNPGKTRDTIFLNEEETEMGGAYSVSINATMTEAGGGAYVLEIDAGYMVNWYSPQVGWYAASEFYDAQGDLMYEMTLSSYQFAQASSTGVNAAPVWTAGDYWNFSVETPSMMGMTYSEYHTMTVTGSDTVGGKECYRVSLSGKMSFTMTFGTMSMTSTEEESGVACYAKTTLAKVHENMTMTSSFETTGGFGATSVSGRDGCTTWDDNPDADCDGVEDDWDWCADTPSQEPVDDFGCGLETQQDDGGGGGGGGGSDTDTDGDGVVDADDYCPDTPVGEVADAFGCGVETQGGNNGSGGGGGGGGGGMPCFPSGTDMTQKTVMRSDLTYGGNGMDEFHFPLSEGTVWSDAAVGTGSMSMSIEMGGCVLMSFDIDGSDALPLNYQHLGTQSFTIGTTPVTGHGIQVFAGRSGNNDWATADFTLLESVPDAVAKMGLPFAAWITVVGFNEFSSTVDISASINAQDAPLMFDMQQLTVTDVGAVIVDTMNLSSGNYVLTITGTSGSFERSITVPFEVDNDPDFEVWTLDPWIVLATGVQWVVPTPIFIEPVNGFGADVSLAVTVPEGVTATLDYGSGKAPFMAILTLTIPSTLSAGDYTVIVTGKSGSNVHADEITFTLTSLPEFSLDIENREQLLKDGTITISGVINAHNGLDLTLGGGLDVTIQPYNQAMLDSVNIEWGTMTNGDLPFTVTLTVDPSTPRNEYTVNLNVIALDGGVTHTASIALVTESSTLDGTAKAADDKAVSSGDTNQYDGTDESANNIQNDDSNGQTSDTEDSASGSSSAVLIVAIIGLLGIIAGVVVVLLRKRGGEDEKLAMSDNLWMDQAPMVNQQFGAPVGFADYGMPAQMAQPSYQPAAPVAMPQPAAPVAQPTYQPAAPVAMPQPAAPVAQPTYQPAAPVAMLEPAAPVAAPAPVMTAPPPPAQPTRVDSYLGLPPGGQYDTSTGQTIYVLPDGSRWQMMGDQSFTKL